MKKSTFAIIRPWQRPRVTACEGSSQVFPDTEITWITTQSTVDLIGPMKGLKWLVVKNPDPFGPLGNH